MPDNSQSESSLGGILLIVSLFFIAARVLVAYAPWPVAFIPLLAWVVLILIRGYLHSKELDKQ